MKSYLALIALGLDAAATRFKSKIEKTAASVVAAFVGIGLLAGSLSLLAEPIGVGRGGNSPPFKNVCAPVISAIYVTNHGSSGITVDVDLSSGGWEHFPLYRNQRRYDFVTWDAVRHSPFLRGVFQNYNSLSTQDRQGRTVYLDWFNLSATGRYFDMTINLNTPESFIHFRGNII